MSVQSIITILERLEKLHKSLLELSYQKTEIVKKGDMAELDNMLKNEQSHVAAIETLEKQRQQAVSEYLTEKGILQAGKQAIADVIEVVENEEERTQLQDVRNRLMLVVDDLRKQNELNQKLVFQSLQFVNMTLDLLRPKPDQINYSGKEARGDNTVQKKSYFDSQA
ncbi:flagellar protein FlgN [Butyricicoccus sp. 1XD8-22]|nr:flagellar protein FlgN [Butyricicoccus sp. 1XD8-22]